MRNSMSCGLTLNMNFAPAVRENRKCEWSRLTPKFTPNSFYKALQHFTPKSEKPWKHRDFFTRIYSILHLLANSNPSPAATEKSETVRFRTSFFLFDPLSDPLTVLQLLPTDGVLHIGFHSICTVLFQHQWKKGKGKVPQRFSLALLHLLWCTA